MVQSRDVENTADVRGTDIDEKPDDMTGRVIRLVSRGGVVETEEGRFRCDLRGAVKRGRKGTRHPVAVGDRVLITVVSPGEGVIEEVLPRRNRFSREVPGRRLEHVLAANADVVVALTSVEKRLFRPGIVDRILAGAEIAEMDGWIVANKVDLTPSRKLEPVLEGWRRAGYRIFLTSAETGEGVEALAEALEDRVTVLMGHSGVGKSSLLRRLSPGLDLKVGELSRKTRRGRHTTTAPEMFCVGKSAHIIDTPGIREFQPFGLESRHLWGVFPEMKSHVQNCRFPTCRHRDEPDCAVRAAVDEGKLDATRYNRYLRFLDSLEEQGS